MANCRLRIANDTEYGLASAVFSGDPERAPLRHRHPRRHDLHQRSDGADRHLRAVRREKNSGLGRFNGEWIAEEFTRPHWISARDQRRRYPF
ncbi:aldehyde dehydrogenase family protein [Lysobacter sp. CA199]|uniref:aldehyde dehydrogenase family protein n=1 Tax=Lysobacter sp. CA199 TaxID=3455608 RepID=UPI003F8D22AA